jgi:hypothetical protein
MTAAQASHLQSAGCCRCFGSTGNLRNLSVPFGNLPNGS